MHLDRTRNTVLALAALTALAAGCSDDDKKTVKNFINSDGGTTTRDTIDLNLGTDAEMTDLDVADGPGAFPVGSDGKVVAHFRQDAQVQANDGEGGTDFDAFNHFRVLGDEPESDGDVDDHARVPYNEFYGLHAQSPNKRFWALVKESGGTNNIGLHEDEEDTPDTFAVVCYDSEAQRYSREVDLVQVIEDDTVFSSQPDDEEAPFTNQVLVDNTGLVTLFFTACPPANFGFDGRRDPNAVYAVQLDARSGKIVRQPEVISSRYQDPTDPRNNVFFRDAAIAANGDIVLAYERDDDDEGLSFETVYYSRRLDAFGDGQQVEFEPFDIEEEGRGVIDADLDTDGRHFQVVVAYEEDDEDEELVVSRRVDTAALDDLLEDTTVATPADLLAEAFGEPEALYSTSDEELGGALRINFGRNGTSIVHWFSRRLFDNVPSSWFAAATGPEDAEGGHQLTDAVELCEGALFDEELQIHSRNNNSEVQFDATPRYAFTDDDTAVIVFGLFDNSDESFPLLFATRFDRAGNGSSGARFFTPSPFQSDDALNGGELDRFFDDADDFSEGLGRSEIEVALSGFTRGSAGSRRTCVVAWRSAYISDEEILDHNHVGAVLFNGIVNENDVSGQGIDGDEENSPDFLEATSSYRIDNFHLASTNDVKTGSSYRFQFDDTVDPDSLPATGTGNVWIAWRQFLPNPAEGQSQSDGDENIPTTGLLRAFLYNFNPDRHDLLAGHQFPEDFSNIENIDEDGDHQNPAEGNDPRLEFGDQNAHVNAIEGIWPHVDGEGTTIFLRQHGTSMKFEFAPSRSETSTPGISEGGRIAPEDMLAHNADARAHVDGMGFSFNVDSKGKFKKSFHGGGRIWSIFDGSDHRSQRVFGKRTR